MSTAIFQLSEQPFDTVKLRQSLLMPNSGAYVSFEGWVRDNHAGRVVISLNYQAHPNLALSEGSSVIKEALERFAVNDAYCVHRVGTLQVSDLAVWVGVSASHRDAAFAASRFIIDAVKARVPIWKHEQYDAGAPLWLHQNPAIS